MPNTPKKEGYRTLQPEEAKSFGHALANRAGVDPDTLLLYESKTDPNLQVVETRIELPDNPFSTLPDNILWVGKTSFTDKRVKPIRQNPKRIKWVGISCLEDRTLAHESFIISAMLPKTTRFISMNERSRFQKDALAKIPSEIRRGISILPINSATRESADSDFYVNYGGPIPEKVLTARDPEKSGIEFADKKIDDFINLYASISQSLLNYMTGNR